MDTSKGKNPRVRDFDPTTEAAGQWASIFASLAPELQPAIDKLGHHVPCPVHGGKDGDAFRLYKDFHSKGGGVCNTCGAKSNGFAVLAWLRDYAFKDAVKEVSDWIRGVQSSPTPVKRIIVPEKPENYEWNRNYVGRIWAASKPIKGTPAELYLLKRGIPANCIPQTLRFHPGMKYVHGKDRIDMGTFPCLLAPIKDKDGLIMSVHRIFVTMDGEKAPVPDAKKMMPKCGPMAGSGIKMYAPGTILGLAEGIETALAVRAGTGLPVWSCVSAVLMERVAIPETVRHVVGFGDLDRSGRGAEVMEFLAKRMAEEGRTFEACLPNREIPADAKGVDWLDIWLTEGIAGFPEHLRFAEMA
jgi:phage/plasmid primase-like uncharacterized protein